MYLMRPIHVKIESEPGGFRPLPQFNEEVRQVVEINADGTGTIRRYVQGFGFRRDVLAYKEAVPLEPDVAEDLLSRIASFFTAGPSCFATDIGDFTLRITFEDGSVLSRTESICMETPTQNGDLGHLIRKAFHRDFLYLFDCGEYEPRYRYALVIFAPGGRTYWYQVPENMHLSPGNKVLVPVGEERKPKMATVQEVHRFSDSDVPMDPDLVKEVLSVVSKQDSSGM